MFGGNSERVEEHQEDHQPVEDIGLDGSPALPSAEPVPSAPVAAGKGPGEKDGAGWEMQISTSVGHSPRLLLTPK